jgi:hypothetical protein
MPHATVDDAQQLHARADVQARIGDASARAASGAPCAVRATVAPLALWAPGLGDDPAFAPWLDDASRDAAPALPQVPALTRRHLAPLGRAAVDVAWRALAADEALPVVFCSRYGEVERSIELITALVTGRELSPTSFSLSVHNAIPGVLSIVRRLAAPTMAIAAGRETAESGFVEACGLLADGAPRALLVMCDLPLPPIYERFVESASQAYAWAAVVQPARGDGSDVTLLATPLADRAGADERPASERTSIPTGLAPFAVLASARERWRQAGDTMHWEWSRGG